MSRVTGWLGQLTHRARGNERRAEAEARLFRGLRLRLTLWYSGVLAASLILAGVGLYLILQYLLLQPITNDVSHQINLIAEQWVRNPERACSSPPGQPRFGANPPSSPIPVYVACYDAQGQPLTSSPFSLNSDDSDTPDPFLNSSLAMRALEQNSASDQVDGGTGIGTIYRSARVVREPGTGEILGVVQVGRSIQEQVSALSLLRDLLFGLGLVALIIATAGGLFLAQRALDPARLAFARQQEFVGDASHELRTPLTLLRANAEMLLRHRERLTEDDAEVVQEIVEETAHIDHLSSDLLLLARLDAGQFHLEQEVVDLADVANSIARRVTALASEKGIEVDARPEGEVRVIGDRLEIERAALILVDNALKHTPAGGNVQLWASVREGVATLTVEDTGGGIAAEHLPHLMTRFYRVDKARSRETGGAGLGLSIAQGIAAAHHGTLSISSEPGKGTTATISLPAAE
ncbi:MAG: ATP-binding protein [Nitrolancea sp.]